MLIIGVAGGTGCGKTTIVNSIINTFPKNEVGLISQDSYYKSTSHLSYEEREKINFDHPNAIDFPLLIEHLTLLKAGKTIKQPVYCFKKHNRTKEELITTPKKVMLIEGILILSYKALRPLLDIKIFIQTDSDERLIRRLKRDILERGRDLNEVLLRYQTTLKPMHNEFIEPAKAFADIIIPNNTYNNAAITIVSALINEKLTT